MRLRYGHLVSVSGVITSPRTLCTPDRANFGHLAEHGVAAIWNSADVEDFRAQLASDEPPEICRSCAVYTGTF